MKRALLCVSAFALWTGARGFDEAHAQETTPPPSRPAQGAVRLHMRVLGKERGRISIREADGSFTPLCDPPCIAEVTGGSELRITYDGVKDQPHTFMVSEDAGAEIDLDVSPPSSGPKIAGIAMMAAGGGIVLMATFIAALGRVGTALSGENDSSTGDAIGYVGAGLGIATAFTGVVVLSGRSLEPRVFSAPHREGDVYGRMQTSFGDLASAKPRDPTTAVPSPRTPLGYSFTF
jgi:hypothetical protein